MPRKPRIVIPGIAHHIIQRGNNRQYIFSEDQDYKTYCFWTNQYAQKYGVSILAYCLMGNHVHFIVIPDSSDGLARMFNSIHMRYAQYMNRKRKTSGHLWQGRFFSCICEGEHLRQAMRYVEQNPVRAKMVLDPWNYAWSSARWHVGAGSERYIQTKAVSFMDKREWKAYLKNEEETINDKLRKATQKGLAFASDTFVARWEKKLNCILHELKAGRPQKSPKDTK